MHLLIETRPDMAFVVGKQSQLMERHTKALWLAVKCAFQYLKGMSTRAIMFCKQLSRNQKIGFCDADYDGHLASKESTSEYVFINVGAAISLKSRTQTSTAV